MTALRSYNDDDFHFKIFSHFSKTKKYVNFESEFYTFYYSKTSLKRTTNFLHTRRKRFITTTTPYRDERETKTYILRQKKSCHKQRN